MIDLFKPVWVITRREVRDQLRDWRIVFPVAGLAILFPFLMNFTARQVLDFARNYGASISTGRLVPFLLMIVGFFPISLSLVIALESFVGEKERGSIEPLLSTPLKDWQLYIGKLLASTVIPLIGSYLGMAVYLTGVVTSHIPLPERELLALVILLTTVQAVVMVSGAVVLSSQATSIRAANLLASMIIIPVALLIQGESMVIFWGNSYHILWWAVFGLAIVAILLVRVGLAHFQREELLGKEVDVLNIKWIIRTFVAGFKCEARSLRDWFTQTVPRTIIDMHITVIILAGCAAVGFYLGMTGVSRYYIPLPFHNIRDLNLQIRSVLETLPLYSTGSMFALFWQNLRVLLISMLMGTISLGVLSPLPLMASTGVTGYLVALLNTNGIPLGQIVVLILPHAIFELTAAIVASAAVLKIGISLATPSPGRTIGEVWLEALAKWTVVMLGIVIPLLLIAAAIEAWVTPWLAVWLSS